MTITVVKNTESTCAQILNWCMPNKYLEMNWECTHDMIYDVANIPGGEGGGLFN